MRAAVYLRQSLDRDQTKLAITRQREDCLKLCEHRGWSAVEYVDNSISASSGKVRPAYQRMLVDITEGKVGAVVAWDADRLHRQPRELEDFIDLADRHKLALATVGGDFDLSTPTGRGNARMKGVFARMEMEQKGARQRRAALQKAELGEPHWRRAFGFRIGAHHDKCPSSCKSAHHELDPVSAPMVRDAYAAIIAGGSITDVARTWNAADAYGIDGRPWTPAVLTQFLRAPRNAGLRAHNGEIVGKGTWPPLVAESTWRTAQAVLNAPGRAPGRKSVRQHLLTGVLGCGKCGHYLSGLQTADLKRIAYTCKKCRGVSIRAEHVEPMVWDLVAGRLAMPDAVDLLKTELHDESEAEQLRNEANTLLARLDEIADERADGDLTGAQARRATERIQEKLAVIERSQQDAERLRVFDGLPLGSPEVVAKVHQLSPDRLRAVIDVLVTLVVAPVGKGGHQFNPQRLRVQFR